MSLPDQEFRCRSGAVDCSEVGGSLLARTANTDPLRDHWSIAVVILCLFVIALLLTPLNGCGTKGAHTSDERLREIDAMLAKDLPAGTSMNRVIFYLDARGYTRENAGDTRRVRAVVRHISLKTLEPSAARVTFAFDAQDKLVTYSMVAAPDAIGP